MAKPTIVTGIGFAARQASHAKVLFMFGDDKHRHREGVFCADLADATPQATTDDHGGEQVAKAGARVEAEDTSLEHSISEVPHVP